MRRALSHNRYSPGARKNTKSQENGRFALYEELLARKVSAGNVDAFLSDAVTLLSVVNDFLAQDKNLVMAANEDDMIPFISRTEM